MFRINLFGAAKKSIAKKRQKRNQKKVPLCALGKVNLCFSILRNIPGRWCNVFVVLRELKSTVKNSSDLELNKYRTLEQRAWRCCGGVNGGPIDIDLSALPKACRGCQERLCREKATLIRVSLNTKRYFVISTG